jgi:hypothetical protein
VPESATFAGYSVTCLSPGFGAEPMIPLAILLIIGGAFGYSFLGINLATIGVVLGIAYLVAAASVRRRF